jgi:hypothetical protein
MNLPTQAQVNAALRYAGTAAGTIGTIAALAGVADQQTMQNIVAAFHAIIDDLTQLFGDLSKLVLLVIPVATFWLAKMGYNSASPASQKASVAAQPNMVVVETTAPIAAANAIAKIPEVKQVVSTQAVADATPSDKVIGPVAAAKAA